MSDEVLKAAIRKRGGLKARLTSFATYLAGLEDALTQAQAQNPNVTLSETKILELKNKLDKVLTSRGEFETIQVCIEEKCDETAVEAQYAERVNYEDLLESLIATATQLTRSQSQTTIVTPPIQQPTPTPPINNAVNTIPQRLKLPTVELPQFSGSFTDWLEFREMFNSLIHSRSDLMPIEKFQYLRLSLKGEAAQVIKSIEFTEANYQSAWKFLGDRYNNDRILVNNHVSSLFNVEPLVKESSSKIRGLLDSVNKNLHALNTLQQPTQHWDTLIVHIISSKLDSETTRKWEEYKTGKQLPTFDDMKTFLKGRADFLESLEQGQTTMKSVKPKDKGQTSKSFASQWIKPCTFCKKNHQFYHCEEFLKLSPKARHEKAIRLKLCINCLKPGHFATTCRGSACKHCEQKHNSLLHNSNLDSVNTSGTLQASTTEQTVTTHTSSVNSYVLLSTVQVKLIGPDGNSVTCRALLDSGSQSNFVSEDLCSRLQLPRTKIHHAISGISENITSVSHKTTVHIQSHFNNFKFSLSCLVLPKVTGEIPSAPIDVSHLQTPTNIVLADPNFDVPDEIHLLIGAPMFWELLLPEQIKRGVNQPSYQSTKLGWILTGSLSTCNLSTSISCLSFDKSNRDLQQQLQTFWEIEENETKANELSSEEIQCERHFVENTIQDPEGRFKVKIPFKQSTTLLGDSRETAIRRFLAVEKRLQGNAFLKTQYTDFMREYISLGHMTQLHADSNSDTSARYFIPHHAVVNMQKSTTKLRVVFDASCKTSTGVSLNELQMVGPRTQPDLFDIILRFRKHEVALTADVEKMYRQVLVSEEQRPLQTIIWRNKVNEPLQQYELNTVTYGMAAAPFLAIRSLQQTAFNNSQNYPQASAAILSDFYVDDFISGSASEEEARKLKTEVTTVLQTGNFTLRKWISSHPAILDASTNQDQVNFSPIGEDGRAKTLGLLWRPSTDTFEFSIHRNSQSTVTKRAVLGTIAQIFDPMGLLSPVVIVAKNFIQKLWQIKSGWDDPISTELTKQWQQFLAELPHLNSLSISRPVLCSKPIQVEVHGFSDASMKAYGACIYLRSKQSDGSITVRLLCAKTKVAPLKALTMPRLELCGALILATLMQRVRNLYKEQIDDFTCYSDSTIILAWIQMSPHLLDTFVSNRVAKIQTLTSTACWIHVATAENPADLLSRGMKATDLRDSSLWFHGPAFLSNPDFQPHKGNSVDVDMEHLPEMRKSVQVSLATSNIQSFPFERFSKLQRIKNTMAYILRYFTKGTERPTGPITVQEMQRAFTSLLRLAQQESFPVEYAALCQGKAIDRKSKLSNLNPFLDDENIIRVGGRLRNANLTFNQKHPIILNAKHQLTLLIFRSEHIRLLHASQQQLLSTIRDNFWPLGGRNLARCVIHKCIQCFRFKTRTIQPKMGDLPKHRVTANAPFQITGVDYAGPFSVKQSLGRSQNLSKCYIALFVCFVTRCIHLELVTSLSTEAFMMALRRFIARRGCPTDLYSDNGTNFVGGQSELKELEEFLDSNHDEITERLANESITWHFTPARSPHFGGLWEAGVKSAKFHLRRIISSKTLTFEQFNTIIVQVEAVLNSRPISPLSSDPDDYTPLTPAHFLVARPLTSLQEPDLTHLKENRLSKYQHLQQMYLHFWKRWNTEYVTELQKRIKWQAGHELLKVGTMVIIKEDNSPPQRWLLGRILELHPGQDGITRVVSVKTATAKVLKRAVCKICPLPIDDLEKDDTDRHYPIDDMEDHEIHEEDSKN